MNADTGQIQAITDDVAWLGEELSGVGSGQT
jgi:hypothetical protein